MLRFALTGKKGFFKDERNVKEIIKSFFAPLIMLLNRDVIISNIEPYSYKILYLLVLKKLRRKVIYLTSWPYWEGEKYIRKPNLIKNLLWDSFLNGITAVAVTEKAQQALAKHGAFSYHIPHAVDSRKFTPKIKREEKSKIVILYVGRLIEEKGIRGILKASENLMEQKVEFWFGGRGALAELIKSSEKKLPVRYLGFIEDENQLIKTYNSADIFILNSYETERWEELFGLSLIEAMSCGLPVIATDCVGPAEIIEDGVNGFLIKQKDEKELSDKLSILIRDSDLRKKIGSNARETVIKHYDVRKTAREWLEILKRCGLLA
jgi:glycosyltransferase involved in cell wall biosynthesis